MNYKTYMLEKITKWVISGALFEEIRSLVAYYMEDSELTSSEKRDAVKDKIKTKVSSVFVNIGIEVAYLTLSEK